MSKEKARMWLETPGMPEELKDMLQHMTEEEISDSFYRDLAFGTGGLRGVLGPGTNRMNVYTVHAATMGLGQYILSASDTPSCAISYDSRIHSKDFAELTAATLAGLGIRVYLYPALMPTPMLSFAVRYYHCTAGVMITASHNPAKFNGYKVYGADGCQITLEVAEEILSLIEKQPILVDALPVLPPYLESGMVSYIGEDTIEAYYACIEKLKVAPTEEKLKVVYSPLNGTGNVPVREMLRRMGNVDVTVVKEQELPDGHFPTCPYPNPEIREAMQLAMDLTVATGADFCFATDPDCDRMGAGVRVGEQVQLISGNDMGVLLLDYLCRHGKMDTDLPRVVVKTIVTTEMAVPLCRKYGVELRNVLTGFKFIGEQIGMLEKAGQKDRYLFGFEESYGYLSGTDVRDKDAVNAAVLLCEMAANLKREGKTMLDQLEALRAEFGYYGQRLLTFAYEGEKGAATMQEIMNNLRRSPEAWGDPALNGCQVTDYLHDDTGLPRSDVLSMTLPDGRKFIVRPSGTEPKLKAYLFASGEDTAAANVRLDALEASVRKLCEA
ncbi:MAG: phospho-sugar mutase [Clostridia bacterium]|nr:phospho-sugar mutase [Clostridia bacterium]